MTGMLELVETARLEKEGAVVLAHRQFRDGAEVWVLNVSQIAGMNGVALQSLPVEVQTAQYELVSVEERNEVAEQLLDALVANRAAEEALKQQVAESFVAALPEDEVDEPTPDPEPPLEPVEPTPEEPVNP